jgi:small subunit ribosomal protein S4
VEIAENQTRMKDTQDMSRYTGPKARINRRLGGMIFESAGAVRASDRRPQPPGMHPGQRKLSKYGESMREKQKIKYYYGLGEKQLYRLYGKAQRQPGNTGENLLLLCERRLDSVVRLAGFAKTRPQARQGVGHGHFLLNGRRTDIASALVHVGDVIHVKRRSQLTDMYRDTLAAGDGDSADWLSVDAEHLQITVLRLPAVGDITLPVDVGAVIELLSR